MWSRLWNWGRRRFRAGARPIPGPGETGENRRNDEYDFDTMVEGLRGQVGLAQRRIEEGIEGRLRRRISLLEDGATDREDLFFHVAAGSQGDDAINLPLASLLYPKMTTVQEVELTLDAAVEVTPGPEPRYSFIFNPDAMKRGTRIVKVSIRMHGPQPGPTEILVEGKTLKSIAKGGEWAVAL